MVSNKERLFLLIIVTFSYFGSPSDVNSYFSGNAFYQTAKTNPDNSWPWVDSVAVFLLGSFANSQTFKLASKFAYHDYFSRAEAAKLTWAKYLKYFYYVIGSGKPDQKILSNPNFCLSLSKSMDSFPGYHEDRFETYNCSGIKVLYFPQCSNSPQGHDGPCCRCESSMRYFLHANRYYHSNKKKRNAYPNWFVFSDDDYVMRTHMLQSIVLNPKNPPHMPFILQPTNSKDSIGMSFGVKRYSSFCSAECIHNIRVC